MTATTTTGEEFGELLRGYRERAGLTQEQLAERAGLSPDAIGLLERGARRHPQRYTVRQLVVALSLEGREGAEFEAAARRGRRILPLPRPEPSRRALPLPPTTFVGRTAEMTGVSRLLLSWPGRLVTLTGPGGVGKTRLALEVAARLTDRFPEGVVLVPLSPLGDPGLVPDAIARVLNVAAETDESPRDALMDALRERRALLILDNFEHLLPAASLVADLLAECPGVVVLITSRAPLRLSAEQQFPVPPFTIPSASEHVDPDVLGRTPAMMLFAQRAGAIDPRFEFTPATVPAVAAICRRVDGLPLAIELAAAWVKTLPPDALLSRLDRALPLLSNGPRDLPDRQQTLRGTITWSYELLTAGERTLLRRLAVFSGGWTIAAAEAVCTREDEPAETILPGLARLVDASLVQPVALGEADVTEPRCTMLETVREYAAELLVVSAEDEDIRIRHARYFLALVEGTQRHLVGPEEGAWLARLEREHPNLRTALRWTLDRREADMSVRFAAVLWRFWAARGHLNEGRRWLEEILTLIAPGGAVGGTGAGIHPLRRAMVLHVTANLLRAQGDYARADDLYHECLAIRREHDDRPGIIGALHNLSITASEQGNYRRAIELHEEALSLARSGTDQYAIAFNLTTFGETMHAVGDLQRAIEFYEEGLDGFRRIQHTWGIALALTRLGDAILARGDVARATALQTESLACSTSLGDPRATAEALEGLARAVVGVAPERAVRMLGTADMLRTRFGCPRSPARRMEHHAAVETALAALGNESFTAAYRAGATLSPNDALAVAGQEGS